MSKKRVGWLISAVVLILVPLLTTSAAEAANRRAPVIEVLSSPARYVSGGDALVAVAAPEGVEPGNLSVRVNGVDVTDQFSPKSGKLEGLVSDLPIGWSRIVARVDGTDRRTQLRIRNHPISGPMFSGSHQDPFICETEAAGLGPALDEDCFAEAKAELFYMNTAGAFSPLPAGDPPADLATTTTSLDETVDYIVRLETGVINRAIYQTAILHDPGAVEGATAGPAAGWNGRLVYTFGGGCNAGYHQGQGNGGVLSDMHLSAGYGVASSSLNVLNNNCNDVLSAETALMVKERFIESYGKPIHTIGWGGSGGAIQQHLIAENYPGILDGIVPTLSYPDGTSIFPGITDCRLLFNFFDDTWDAAARDAVVGYDSWNNCLAWEFTFANRIDATTGCQPAVPAALIYDPTTNPDGARCAVTDGLVNILGRDPRTGNAWTLHDNVGVQYGLDALNSGAITVDQFLDLNEGIGGFDQDGVVQSDRSVAQERGLRAAYRTGRIISGKGLATVPILDFRPYLEPTGDIHDRFRSFSMRHRLIEANGNADNQVIWISGDFGSWLALLPAALATMDEWLSNLDTASPTAAEVASARPADLVDSCWSPDGTRIDEPASFTDPTTECNQLYPNNLDPRLAAGQPVQADLMKCHRTRPGIHAYEAEFSTEQFARLRSIFADGICNYGRPGVGQSRWAGPWQSFGR